MVKQIKRQHLVSRFCLDGFSNENQRVRRVELPGERSVVMSTRDSMVIKDFYSLPLTDGSTTDVMERVFGEVEGPASRAIRKVTQGVWALPREDKDALAVWIGLQHLRGEQPRNDEAYVRVEIIRLVVRTSGRERLRRGQGPYRY